MPVDATAMPLPVEIARSCLRREARTTFLPRYSGNMKLEECITQDGQFVAAQLLSFKDFSYQPVTEMKVYTGKTAEAFAKLF